MSRPPFDARPGATVVLLLTGCSFSTYDYTPCETHAECREAFGFGYTCDDDGLCGEVEVEPRCGETWPPDLFERAEDHRDAIVLGSLFDYEAGAPQRQAARLAFTQVADLSGLDGRPVALVECNYAANPRLDDLPADEATRLAAAWLAETLGVPAIIGPSTSATAEAAYYVTSPVGTVLLSPSATSPSLSVIDGITKTDDAPGLFWRTAPPDSLQGAVVAEDMRRRGTTNVAVLYQTGSYGEGLAGVFNTAFVERGGVVVLYPFADATARDVAVTAVASNTPNEVLFISSLGSDVAAFLNAAAVLDAYVDVPLFLTDSARDEDVLADAASAAALFDQVRGTSPSVPAGDVYSFFSGAYASAYAPDAASDSVYTAHAWDAAWLAIYGVAWSASNEGAISGIGVARGLRHLSSGPAISLNPTSWTEGRAWFADGEGIDVTGASGSLDFNPDTEETTAPIDVWIITADAGGASFATEYTSEP